MSERGEASYLPAPTGGGRLDRRAVTGTYPLAAGHDTGEAEDQPSGRLPGVWRVIKKRKRVVLSVLLLVVAASAVYTYRAQPIYRASGKAIIHQPVTPQLATEPPAPPAPPTDRQYVQTQLTVLRSRTLAKRVIEALSLRQRPEFAAPPQDPNLRDTWLTDRFLSGLKAKVVGGTRIVEVSYESHDARLAAQIVNGLLDQWIEYTLTARFDSTKQARRWLKKRLDQLRQSLKQMREELARYGRENDVVQLGENQTIAVQRLTDLTRRLVEAETERIRAETLYRLSRGAAAEAPANGAEAGTRPGKVAVDALPFVVADPVVQALRQRLAGDRRKLAELERQYTDQWPEIKKLKGQIEESERQLAETKQRILAKIEADYKAAVAREDDLRAELKRQRDETVQQNERALNLSMKQQQIRARAQLYDGLLQKWNDMELLSTLTASHIQVLDRAQVPLTPVRPRPMLNLGGGLLTGLLLGTLLALFLEYRDTAIRSAEDVDHRLGLPVLGVVPARQSLQRRSRLALPRLGRRRRQEPPILILDELHRSGFADAFRSLRTAVLLSQAEAPPHTILFTSSIPGEGKTTTAVNTAISLAQTGARVILVDGDLRKPRLHTLLNVKNQTGLSTYLTRPIGLDAVIEQNQIENLWVIASGPIPPNPSELLASRKMRDAVAALSRRYEFVVFDSPPASTPDTLVLSTLVDGVVLVVRSEETARELARRARRSLEQVKAKIFGVVLNQVDVQRDEFYYYYYRYDAGDEPRQPPRLD